MNRMENQEIELHMQAQLIFDKRAKAFQWRKDRNGAGAIAHPQAKK